MVRVAKLGPCDPSSIPLGEKKKINKKRVGPYLKKIYGNFVRARLG